MVDVLSDHGKCDFPIGWLGLVSWQQQVALHQSALALASSLFVNDVIRVQQDGVVLNIRVNEFIGVKAASFEAQVFISVYPENNKRAELITVF